MSLDIFAGTWRQVEEMPENVKEYMDALGVPEEHQVPFMNARMTFEYSGEGDNWVTKITLDGMPVVKQYDFKLGEEFSSTDMLGKPFTGKLIKLADNKVKESIIENSGREITSTRTIENGEMTVEATFKEITCISKFKKL